MECRVVSRYMYILYNVQLDKHIHNPKPFI